MPVVPRRNPLLSFVVAAVLVLLALYLGYAAQTAAEPGPLARGGGRPGAARR